MIPGHVEGGCIDTWWVKIMRLRGKKIKLIFFFINVNEQNKENAETWARNITTVPYRGSGWHSTFHFKERYISCYGIIFKNNFAYFLLLKNIYDVNGMLTLLPLALIKHQQKHARHSSLLDILDQEGFRGSSHEQLILFLTFNYSLNPVRESLICPLLYLLLCQDQWSDPYHPSSDLL